MNTTPILRTERDQLTVEAVAHYLRVDAQTVTGWLESAQLGGYRLPTGWLVMSDDLQAFLAAAHQPANMAVRSESPR